MNDPNPLNGSLRDSFTLDGGVLPRSEARLSWPWASPNSPWPRIPVITQQPTNQTVYVGGNATMSVQATSTNGPVTYQWQRADGAVPVAFTNIPERDRARSDLA
jgi:hypothetical protein